MRRATDVHDLEGVERVPVPSRVDLGVDDTEADRPEVARDAREQVALVGYVDHDLQSFACRREARLDYRLVCALSVVQQPRLPGDLLGVVAQEIRDIQMAPQDILDGVRQAVEAQQALGFVLLALDVLVRLERPALQQVLRRAKEILEKLAFPGVPHLRARTADIRDREQIERDQPPLAANDIGEAPQDLRIGQVLFLRHRRHGEMVLDQKLDELRVFGRKAMLAAETPGLDPAELRVIASAALGDIVEDRRDVQQPMALEAGYEAAAQRILVRKLKHREAAHVAHDGEDVLVHGVHVEQIVLHLADDATEGRQIPSQDAVLIHSPKFVHDAARLLQQRKESRAVARISPEGSVNARARAPERAQRLRRHAFQLRVLLHDEKTLEDRARLALEQIGRVRLQQFAHPPELFADLRATGI